MDAEAFRVLATLAVVIAVLLLLIMWLMLPVLVSRTNGRLDRLISLQAKVLEQQMDAADSLRKLTSEAEEITGSHHADSRADHVSS